MNIEELDSALKEVKKRKGIAFVKEFCDGTVFNLPDGSLLVDGKPKTNYTGIDCMQALTLPAYFSGFDAGVDAVIEILQNDSL